MLRALASRLPEKQKRYLRGKVNAARLAIAKTFRSYDSAALTQALRRMGVVDTDVLLVHANFRTDSGFQGTPNDLVTAFADLVGTRGALLMVSQPFRGYAYDYLALGKTFRVDRTVSMMGLVTEMFRRRPGTLRSLHPTHPVLAMGRHAEAIVAGHEACRYPCGAGSPFDKFRQLGGKILFFDVGSGANTFFHHVEDLLADELSFPIYDSKLFSVTVIDAEGQSREVSTYALARGVRRHTDRLETELSRRGKLTHARIGNSRMILVDASDVVDVMSDMIKAREPLIEPPSG